MATNKNFEVKNGLSVGGTERISSAGAFAGSLASGVTATTQSAADSSTKIATTAYTDAAITALIGGAPSALNDLNELAAAIADDANYSTTLTTALATKLPLAGGTLTGDLILGDNVKIEIGSASGGDLQLYHDGGNSYIKNTTGWLNMPVGGNGISIANSDFSEQIAKFLPNGACELYYNGSEKLATASGGVTVTGTLTATNLNVVHSGQAIIKAEGVNQYYVGMMIKNNYSSTQSQWHVAAAGGSSGWGASNGNFIIRDDTTNSTAIEAEIGAGGASGALYIDSDGNVAIGTTGPVSSGYDTGSRKLTVMSTALNNATSGYLELASRANSNGYNAGAIQFNNFENAGLAGSGAQNRTVGQIRTVIATTDSNAGDDSGGTMEFYTKSEAGNLTQNMTIYSNGNVGIGNTAPIAMLHVGKSTTAAATAVITHENSGGYGSLDIDSHGSATLRLLSNFSGSTINGMADDTFSLQTPHNYPILFGTSGTERMRIASDGKVGIGTNNPSSPLHVKTTNQSIQIRNTGNDNVGLEIYRDSDGAKGASFAWGNGNANLEIKNYRNDGQSTGPYANIDFFTGGTTADSPDYAPTRRMRIQQTGEVGIGTDDPTSALHVDKSHTGTLVTFHQTAGSSSDDRGLDVETSSTGTSVQRWYNSGTKLAQVSGSGNFSVAHTGSADTSGYFYAGRDFGASNHRINRSVTQGNYVLVVSGYGGSGIGADTALFYSASTGGRNSAGTAMAVEKNGSTGRSINAAGTINASGNDYAEYMEKKSTAFEISAGDICGVNENGKLTNKFTEAHSFVVKSTDPSYVGGDVWGNEDAVGKRPELTNQGYVNPEEKAPETDAEYVIRTTQHETDLAAFEIALEAERVKYDRIAFSGQVPCNLTGANVGDYIIPKEGTSDAITGEAVSSPTFEQYQKAIGKVWKVLDNGNAWISVKIG